MRIDRRISVAPGSRSTPPATGTRSSAPFGPATSGSAFVRWPGLDMAPQPPGRWWRPAEPGCASILADEKPIDVFVDGRAGLNRYGLIKQRKARQQGVTHL